MSERNKPPVQRVVVVGLGLIGGSCAPATRRAWSGVELVGVDREAIAEVARERGVVDKAFTEDELPAAVEGADLVVLALPVMEICRVIDVHGADLKDLVVTDTGSTKSAIQARAERAGLARFIGGHPMAGKPTGGLAHADPKLLVGATWFVCPEEAVDEAALRVLRSWVRGVGANPVEIGCVEHDRAVAVTSHLPHILANALSEEVLAGAVLDAAGGSLRDILRVAGAPFDVWWDTLRTNEDAIDTALEEFISRLQRLREELDSRDRVRALFSQGRACRERLARVTERDQ